MSDISRNLDQKITNWVKERPILKKVHEYCARVFLKFTEIILSLKVWILVTTFILSTVLLKQNLLNGDQWVTTNTIIIPSIAVSREISKIGRIFGDVKRKAIEKLSNSQNVDG